MPGAVLGAEYVAVIKTDKVCTLFGTSTLVERNKQLKISSSISNYEGNKSWEGYLGRVFRTGLFES